MSPGSRSISERRERVQNVCSPSVPGAPRATLPAQDSTSSTVASHEIGAAHLPSPILWCGDTRFRRGRTCPLRDKPGSEGSFKTAFRVGCPPVARSVHRDRRTAGIRSHVALAGFAACLYSEMGRKTDSSSRRAMPASSGASPARRLWRWIWRRGAVQLVEVSSLVPYHID